MGAVIDDRAFGRLSKALDRARGNGLDLGARRRHATTTARATSSGPRSCVGTDPTDEIFTTEYFGPILSVHVYDDADYDAMRCGRWSRPRRTR